MKKVINFLVLLLFAFLIYSCTGEQQGRITYKEWFKYMLDDPSSFEVFDESVELTNEDEGIYSWTISYGYRNKYGGMEREVAKFDTMDDQIRFSGDNYWMHRANIKSLARFRK